MKSHNAKTTKDKFAAKLWLLLAVLLAGLAFTPSTGLAMQNEPQSFGKARWGEQVGRYKWLVQTGCSLGYTSESGRFFPETPKKGVACYRARQLKQSIGGQPLEKLVYLAFDGRLFAVRGAFRGGSDLGPILASFTKRMGEPDKPQADPSGLAKANPGSFVWIGRSVWAGLRQSPAGFPEFFMFYAPMAKAWKRR